MPTPINILWYLSILVELAVVWKIVHTGLGRQFQFFRLYLAASATASLSMIAAAFFLKDPNWQGYIYVRWVYLSTLFEFLVILELCNLALKPFPAIQAASRRALQVAWVLLVVIFAAWYWYLSLQPAARFPILRAAVRFQDASTVCFALFIFLFLAFLSWMPVPLSRNLLNHSFLVGALYLCIASSRFLTEFRTFGLQVQLANYISVGTTLLLCLLWFVVIKPGQDDSLNTPRGPVNRADAEKMLSRLSELNATIARSGPFSRR